MNHDTSGMLAATLPSSLSVMVIDDDDLTQELMSEMLSALGCKETHTAGNGRLALKMLASLPRLPEVLLCDIFMPEMDGVEFINELAQKRYAGGIIFMSGVDPEMLRLTQTIAEASGLRVLGSVLKPASMDVISALLKLAPASQ